MNKKEAPPSHQHSHDHTAQDNCEGCQEERRENNLLVEFYDRLNKIQGKVGRIKDGVASQQVKEHAYRKKMQEMNVLLNNKPENALQMIKEHDSKEMGYELASALIEREIKTKMENQRLQGIIEQLQKDKLKLESQKKRHFSRENNRSISQPQRKLFQNGSNQQSRYSDVIDEVRKTNDSSYFIPRKKAKDMSNSYFEGEGGGGGGKNYWEDVALGQDQTNFSNFTAALKKEKSKSQSKQTYEGLNLWLYQFKPEEIDQTPIKALRKPANHRKIGQANNDKGRSKVNRV